MRRLELSYSLTGQYQVKAYNSHGAIVCERLSLFPIVQTLPFATIDYSYSTDLISLSLHSVGRAGAPGAARVTLKIPSKANLLHLE